MAGSSVFLFHRPNLMDCHGADKVGEVVMRVKIARAAHVRSKPLRLDARTSGHTVSGAKGATRFANQSLPDGERSFDESFHERCSKQAGEPVLNLWSAELTPGLMQKHESRAMRGFEYGGPSRTRTYDQGIMSHKISGIELPRET